MCFKWKIERQDKSTKILNDRTSFKWREKRLLIVAYTLMNLAVRQVPKSFQQ